MSNLKVYVSASCEGCAVALALVEYVRRLRPRHTIEIIDLDQAGAVRPSHVFGTPTYCLDNRIVSLGNPSAQELLQFLDQVAPPGTPTSTSAMLPEHM